MNNELLKELLIDELDVQIKNVDGIVEQIDTFQDDLKKELFTYIEKGSKSNVAINDYTINIIKEKYALNEIGAFLALNWIEKDEKSAIYHLEYGI